MAVSVLVASHIYCKQGTTEARNVNKHRKKKILRKVCFLQLKDQEKESIAIVNILTVTPLLQPNTSGPHITPRK